MSIVEQILNVLLAGLTEVPTAIGEALNSGMTAIFINSEGNIANFAYVVLAFGGVALALALCKLVFNVIRSKIG